MNICQYRFIMLNFIETGDKIDSLVECSGCPKMTFMIKRTL